MRTLACSIIVAVLGLAVRHPTYGQATQPVPPGVTVEAEDFKPIGDGWAPVMNGHGNYMIDIIGFQHISGERLLSGDAKAADAKAVATVQIPEAGDYRVWSRYETPTGTNEIFHVEIRQNGQLVGSGVMGERDAGKYWFGGKTPIAQYDASWGSEGLAEQAFDVKGLTAGPAEITLIAPAQPDPAANRNIDFLWLTKDLSDSWREKPVNRLYPILDAALRHVPTRYWYRLTSPRAQVVTMRQVMNRQPFYTRPITYKLEANKPTDWIAWTDQDTSHFTTMHVAAQKGMLDIKVEFAGSANGSPLYRAIEWSDPAAAGLQVSVPPYPGKYPGERIITTEEQCQEIAVYLKQNPSTVGKEPTVGLNWGGYMPVWSRGRYADASAELYHAMGMRMFVGFIGVPTKLGGGQSNIDAVTVARERFKQWGLTPGRQIALGRYRCMPTLENVTLARRHAEEGGFLDLVHRFDYGDEIAFSEWLSLVKPDELNARFAEWQKAHRGQVKFEKPDSTAQASREDPELYVDSMKFYEDAAIETVANLAREIPKQFGEEVLYGANVSGHPFYYPEIAKNIKFYRRGAANFGRHSEYFWQLGQPGPLVNGYVADFFRAGMRDNPRAVNLQYTMPHSPGNIDSNFRRTAFTHVAHGARGLDYFGIGTNPTFTENYIDFRDKERFVAIRDINRAMATIEDMLPDSRPIPTRVAMIVSDSTEHWDVAGLAQDKANLGVFGPDYKKMRLAYHLDRVGMYYALVHAGRAPEILIEEDVNAGKLAEFDVAYWVGDCAPAKVIAAIDQWVQGGGRLVATAGAMRHDEYRRPQTAGNALLGLKSAKLDEQTTFIRPQIELPRLKPIDLAGRMPAIGVIDRVEAGDAKVIAIFDKGGPAVLERAVGKGHITYVAALPGVAYLWSAYPPGIVPSRGPSSHFLLTDFNADAAKLITTPALSARSQMDIAGGRLDARLLKSPKGLALAAANYSPDEKQPITVTLRDLGTVSKVTSASSGEVKFEPAEGGGVRFSHRFGYGDILRIEAQ